MKAKRERISKELRQQVYRTYGDRCWLCRRVVTGIRSVDHVKPVKAGGTNLLGNLRPCCKSCNEHRGAPKPINGLYSR